MHKRTSSVISRAILSAIHGFSASRFTRRRSTFFSRPNFYNQHTVRNTTDSITFGIRNGHLNYLAGLVLYFLSELGITFKAIVMNSWFSRFGHVKSKQTDGHEHCRSIIYRYLCKSFGSSVIAM